MALPAGILFRHCVAGDQWPDPADPLRIDQALLAHLQAKVTPMAWHCCSSSSGQRRICSLSTAMAAQWALWCSAVSERHVSF
jgi:hypothetical protein